MNPDLDFTYSENTYYCKLCPLARGTTHWSRHVRSAAHQRNVERLETASRPISPPRPISPDPIAAARAPPAQAEDAVFHVGGPGLFELNKDPPISAPYVQGFIAALAADHRPIAQAHYSQLRSDLMAIACHKGDRIPEEDAPVVWTDKRSNRVDRSGWFPFKSKLDLVASLVIV
ncbi:hypothetical protein PtA15_2A458 [Puccinia triticina]|uniref:U1-type domain-containing protein n=1 Tax=Puccinia triticina TaxID=208348 RepID=A0ABY7CAV3_9BASI|nr:uncharacterized protein PtA15_2A458 [Puccinia triticina]WAQ82144.1 hypothetical protein PtA15_2A458 [Puccinia triticina]